MESENNSIKDNVDENILVEQTENPIVASDKSLMQGTDYKSQESTESLSKSDNMDKKPLLSQSGT